MRRILATLVLGFTAISAPAFADEAQPKAVVELFTSQGCYSCPPADAALETLVKEGNTLALAYHVDYWNYLGWADTLSSKENTERQYGYARTLKRSGVYTPQAVVNGRDEMVGSYLNRIKSSISDLKQSGKGLNVPVKADMKGEEINISIGAGAGKADVVIAYYKRNEAVKITRGENAGKTISYWNSVTKLSTVGMWDGKAMTIKLPMSVMEGSKYDGCAILLQSFGPGGEPGPIYGATSVSYVHG